MERFDWDQIREDAAAGRTKKLYPECIYCNVEMPVEVPASLPEEADLTDYLPAVPASGDDEAWHDLAAAHAEGCEWIATRAHKINPAAVSKLRTP